MALLRDEIASETPHLALRQAGADQHSVLQILALVDRRAERVELGELPAVLVRQQQPNVLVPVGESIGDPRTELVEALAGHRRDLHRAWKAVRQPLAAQRIDAVDLVQDELERHLVRPDLVQDGVHRVDHLLQPVVGLRRIDDVQDEIRDERLLQRRGEALDELGRQAADETDRVRDEIPLAVVLEGARRRIQRLEQAVLDAHLGAGESVQKRRLADVRVAGERDARRAARARSFRPNPRACRPRAAGGAGARSCGGRSAGRSRAGTRRAPASRLRPRARPNRRRGARGAATCHACAAGCTRAGRARPEAFPRHSWRAGRRCRGSAAFDRRRVRSAHSRARAAATARARRRRGAPQPWSRRRPASAPRACPSPHTFARPGSRAAGRARRSARRPPCARARAARPAPPRRRRTSGARPARARVRARSGCWRVVTPGIVPRLSPMSALADRLAARTLELVNIPSESRNEAEIAAHVRSLVPPSFEPEYEGDDAFVWARPRSAGRPLIVLAGHYDTVPAQENVPGRIENGAVVGLGASDMKGGLAVMLELARALDAGRDRAGGRRRPPRLRQGGAAGRVQPAARPLRSLAARARG